MILPVASHWYAHCVGELRRYVGAVALGAELYSSTGLVMSLVPLTPVGLTVSTLLLAMYASRPA